LSARLTVFGETPVFQEVEGVNIEPEEEVVSRDFESLLVGETSRCLVVVRAECFDGREGAALEKEVRQSDL